MKMKKEEKKSRANEKGSPLMAWEEDQKLPLAWCAHNPHNTTAANTKHVAQQPGGGRKERWREERNRRRMENAGKVGMDC
ncbi:hypothetical protein EYF80_039392 [Liparis tanakae]|uniref:Uncharacterized protein n=1 Tax=Liparis tanakae TaxID=230148 RepID=A0A4Z2GBH1_9TELE|nr:hypothetical protein EYF80_039392 [Liparis tanakae]